MISFARALQTTPGFEVLPATERVLATTLALCEQLEAKANLVQSLLVTMPSAFVDTNILLLRRQSTSRRTLKSARFDLSLWDSMIIAAAQG